MKRLILLLATPVIFGACGFQPVYAPAASSAEYGSIIIDDIPGRSGHALRKALMQQLAPGLPGFNNATLTVTLDEKLARLAFRPDQAASRTDVRATGRYVLATQDNAISGRVTAETSFNVPDAPYGDIAAQTDASQRAMNLLAQRIVSDIQLQLAQQDK